MTLRSFILFIWPLALWGGLCILAAPWQPAWAARSDKIGKLGKSARAGAHAGGKAAKAANREDELIGHLPLLSPLDAADAQFCGVMDEPAAAVALSHACPAPGLPCGPAPAAEIGPSGSDPAEDLDGDGHPDIVLAGRREGTRPTAFGVIYLWHAAGAAGPEGYALADYQTVDPVADPAVATVVQGGPQKRPGQAIPPLVRDGYDMAPADGKSLSVARLRRWDGQRFRTLLTFCAHRSATRPDGTIRDGENRAEVVDIDKDGTAEVVLSGLLRPLVFRFGDNGLSLQQDAELTRRYRDSSPEVARARALREQARRLVAQGEWRKAAALLEQARGIYRYDVDAALQLAQVRLKLGEVPQAIEALHTAQAIEPARAAIDCALGDAYRVSGDDEEEEKALHACLSKDPENSLQRAALARLREIQEEREKDRQEELARQKAAEQAAAASAGQTPPAPGQPAPGQPTLGQPTPGQPTADPLAPAQATP